MISCVYVPETNIEYQYYLNGDIGGNGDDIGELAQQMERG